MVFKHTSGTIPPHQISIAHSRATRNVTQIRETTLSSYELASPEWLVLGHVEAQGGKDGIKVGDIAQALGVQSTYVTGTLRTLLSKGLVKMSVHPVDKRARCVTASKQGSLLVRAIDTELESKMVKILDKISDSTLRGYIEVLERLAAADSIAQE